MLFREGFELLWIKHVNRKGYSKSVLEKEIKKIRFSKQGQQSNLPPPT